MLPNALGNERDDAARARHGVDELFGGVEVFTLTHSLILASPADAPECDWPQRA